MSNPDVKTTGVSPEAFTEDAMTDVVEIQDASSVVGFLREAIELRQNGVKSAAHERKVDLALEAALAFLASDEELRDFSDTENREILGPTDNSQSEERNPDIAMGWRGTVKAEPTSTRSNEPRNKRN